MKDLGVGVADGARTHDNRNHNPGLYQLSYSHRQEIITVAAYLAAVKSASVETGAGWGTMISVLKRSFKRL